MSFLESRQAEDLMLVLATAMIAIGLYDHSRMLLILAGCAIFFVVLVGESGTELG